MAAPKPFLSYAQQLDKLEHEKNLIIADRDVAEAKLKSISYFTEQNGELQVAYLPPKNYSTNPNHNKGIQKLIKILKAIAVTSTDYDYINYQCRQYGNIPLWVLINVLMFGNISKMYQFFPQSLQAKASKNFAKVNEKELQQYLKVLTKFRNVCAHNERLFSYKTKDDIPDTILHIKLGIAQRGTQFSCGKHDLFGVVVAFRYLLPKKDFLVFKRDLGRIIEHFLRQTNHITEIELLTQMGFPQNWKKISAYQL